VAIMLELVERCFPARWPAWREKCRALMPSLGRALHADAGLCREARRRSAARLGLAR
jgi:malate dehydrogenase (quinone)